MDELDDYEGEDWRGWVAGKYDNRYEGVRRHSKESEYSYSTNTGSKKKKVSFVFLGLIACFCAISISGNLLLNSNDYLDVELTMMFYYNILTGIIYEDEIQKDIHKFKEKIVAYIEDKGMLVKEKLKNKRIENENRRIQETIEREKEELVDNAASDSIIIHEVVDNAVSDIITYKVVDNAVSDEVLDSALSAWTDLNPELEFVAFPFPEIEIVSGEIECGIGHNGYLIENVCQSGYYSSNGTIYVANSLNPGEQVVTLSHEIGHALGLDHHCDQSHLMYSFLNLCMNNDKYDDLGYNIPRFEGCVKVSNIVYCGTLWYILK